MDSKFLLHLKSFLPEGGLLTTAEACAPYATDWTRTPGIAEVVALPRSVEQVSRLLAYCTQYKVPVVPSGGRTGLAAGAVPSKGQLVLSLSQLRRMEPVRVLTRTVRVGAGAITQEVHQHCEPYGLTWPIDLASKGSCQVGGNLSTNAGGLRVIRHGMARKWVTSLQIVLMDGTILELNSELEKNNTGYDLLQLVVGSEGTLAVITEATLKLAPIPVDAGRSVCLFAVSGLEGLPFLFESARTGPFEILAFEFFSERCLQAVEKELGRPSRLQKRGAYYVLAEIAGTAPRDVWFSQVLENPLVVDAFEAHASEDVHAVWGLREGITESLAKRAPLRKHDLSVPLPHVAGFLGEVEGLVAKGGFKVDLYFFGHFGDGSPHVNLVCPKGTAAQAFEADCDRLEEKLFPVLKKYSGSISSEHGIGLLKKKWLQYSRTAEELRLFRGIKQAWDPQGLLNPGKIFD